VRSGSDCLPGFIIRHSPPSADALGQLSRSAGERVRSSPALWRKGAADRVAPGRLLFERVEQTAHLPPQAVGLGRAIPAPETSPTSSTANSRRIVEDFSSTRDTCLVKYPPQPFISRRARNQPRGFSIRGRVMGVSSGQTAAPGSYGRSPPPLPASCPARMPRPGSSGFWPSLRGISPIRDHDRADHEPQSKYDRRPPRGPGAAADALAARPQLRPGIRALGDLIVTARSPSQPRRAHEHRLGEDRQLHMDVVALRAGRTDAARYDSRQRIDGGAAAQKPGRPSLEPRIWPSSIDGRDRHVGPFVGRQSEALLPPVAAVAKVDRQRIMGSGPGSKTLRRPAAARGPPRAPRAGHRARTSRKLVEIADILAFGDGISSPAPLGVRHGTS